ncbi:MAG: MlaD family protein [bacterium]|nr:MlaD family protein [bacterium]
MHRIRYLIGVLTLVAAIAGALWIVRLLQQLDDRPGVLVRIEFQDARGLRAGADVRYRGVRAGLVREVAVGEDGTRAVVQALLDPTAALHARVNSSFWIVTPRFTGLTGGVSGLDTLVRDSYLAFETPAEPGSVLAAGSLVAGLERPPAGVARQQLEDLEPGDLRMQVLLPENHGLRPGSPVTFRGVRTGEVRAVTLAPEGTHVVADVRILRSHRQTVTDKSVFWVARPQLSGALFSGFRVDDVSALLSPFVAYYSEPGAGLPVEDDHRAVAQPMRPELDVAAVPAEALARATPMGAAATDDVVIVRIVYAAVEEDTFSANDPVHVEGSGVLYVDRSGRPVVVTARSLVDGTFLDLEAFGDDPEITDEQIKVMLPSGAVLHAGRVWVEPAGADLAALVLTQSPEDLRGTATERLMFGDAAGASSPFELRRAAADGNAVPAEVFNQASPQSLATMRGAAVLGGGKILGIYGQSPTDAEEPIVVALRLLPDDLRPHEQ